MKCQLALRYRLVNDNSRNLNVRLVCITSRPEDITLAAWEQELRLTFQTDIGLVLDRKKYDE
jgi:hypothetical protein